MSPMSSRGIKDAERRERSERAEGGGGSSSPKAKLRGAKAPRGQYGIGDAVPPCGPGAWQATCVSFWFEEK